VLVLLAVDAAGDLVVLAVPADLARDVVLRHQVHVGALAELLSNEAEDRLGLLVEAGHDQVPEDEAAPRHSALVQQELADLAVHLDDRLAPRSAASPRPSLAARRAMAANRQRSCSSSRSFAWISGRRSPRCLSSCSSNVST
jgi:hypothetical protein